MDGVLERVCACAAEAEARVVADVWQAAYAANTEAVAREAAPLVAARLGRSAETDRRMCMVIAELGKDEASREPLGVVLVEPVVGVVKRATEARDRPTRFQALRALGNMCYEHDANRHRVLDCGGVSTILQSVAVFQQVLEGETEETDAARRATSGVLLNLASDNERAQKELVACGVMESLAWLLRHQGDTDMAYRALSVFHENDTALDSFCASGGLRGIVDHLLALPAGEEASQEQLDLLRAVIKLDRLLPHLAKEGLLPDLLTLSMREASMELAGLCAMSVAVALSDDACLQVLFGAGGEIRDRLLRCVTHWLEEAQRSNNYDMPSAGALAAGNIVRSDENSRLVAAMPGLLEALIKLAASDRMGFQHNALGALKNLTRLPANKERCLQLGLLPASISSLGSSAGPVQYRAATLIRSLCLPPNAAEVIVQLAAAEGLVERLVHLGRQEDEHVRAESTRALCNFVKNGASAAINRQVVEAGAVANISAFLESKFPTLQSEMLVALVLLVTTVPAASDAVAQAGGRERAQAIHDNSPIPELRQNAASLLAALK